MNSRPLFRSALLLFALASSALASDGGEPWASMTTPTDAPKQHVETIITASPHKYTVTQGGTMDGDNCRSPLGCGISREGVLEQTWESNRSVRLENTGDSDVVNPWLSNGHTGRTIAEIVASAVTPGMQDREKAMALWFQEIQHRYHWAGDNNELGDPVKVFNIYGHNTCGNDSICMAGLWKTAGLKIAPALVVGHCITQAFYDGRWHLLDGDQHTIYLLRDNETIASEQDIVRDHELISRTHTQGILQPENRIEEQHECSRHVFEGPAGGDRNSKMDTTMNMTLRPGEAITWRWGHLNPAKFRGRKPLYPDTIYNGNWEYQPDFAKDVWRKGATVENVTASSGTLAAETGKTGTIVWTIKSPYVFIGGRFEAEPAGAKFMVSTDGKTWKDAGPNLDAFFSPEGAAVYEYKIKCQLSGDAQLKRLRIVNDIQMAPFALPSMKVGENTFVYTDDTKGERQVRITHNWVERSLAKPPAAPPSAVAPADAGETSGTDIVFQWAPATDPDGNKIADYQFELANRPDMKWPLSTSFYKLISRTNDKGKAQFTLPMPGLLASERKYYWHVRAKNDKGVWGPWSKTWSFTVHAPEYPLDVAVDFDADKSVGTLRWKPNPAGRTPVKYRVYGSDEKGFSISDVPYTAQLGSTKDLPPQFPANFIAETSAMELAVLGAGVKLPAANKTYFRVVAIDNQDKRSGPSDYATAPRPIIYSTPAASAKAKAEFKYQLAANRSLGDLRMRVINGGETACYWDIEKPKFSIKQGPAWLKIDGATGMLSGTPDSAGNVDVVVTAEIDREVRKLDEGALKWGDEKVTSTTTDHVGTATQKFTIEVGP